MSSIPPSADTRALLDGWRATAKASDDAAAARAQAAEEATERRHRERIAHELAQQAAAAAGWNVDRANAAIMVAELLPLGLDEAAMVARVRLGLRVLDAVTADKVPDPLPADPAPPVALPWDQADRFLATYRADFAKNGITTWQQVQVWWVKQGRDDILAGRLRYVE